MTEGDCKEKAHLVHHVFDELDTLIDQISHNPDLKERVEGSKSVKNILTALEEAFVKHIDEKHRNDQEEKLPSGKAVVQDNP